MRIFKDYALGIVLLAQWWLTWAGYYVSLWVYNELRPESNFWEWLTGSLENIQSENYQTFNMVVLTTYLIYKGSAESKDGMDRIERKIDLLLRRRDE